MQTEPILLLQALQVQATENLMCVLDLMKRIWKYNGQNRYIRGVQSQQHQNLCKESLFSFLKGDLGVGIEEAQPTNQDAGFMVVLSPSSTDHKTVQFEFKIAYCYNSHHVLIVKNFIAEKGNLN